MQDLNEIVLESMDLLSESGKIELMISKKLESVVKDAIERELSSCSDFGKNLRRHIKECVGIDFSSLGIDGYNDHMLRMIGTIMDKQMQGESKERLEATLTEMLSDPPKEIKLSELIELFKENFTEEANAESIDCMTCIVEGRCDKFFTHVYMSMKENTEKYQCDYRFGLRLDRETGIRTVYTMTISGANLKKGLFVGPFYGLERLMYQMHCCGTSVVLDLEDGEMDLDYDLEDEY